jgi:hypothetical protein
MGMPCASLSPMFRGLQTTAIAKRKKTKYGERRHLMVRVEWNAGL